MRCVVTGTFSHKSYLIDENSLGWRSKNSLVSNLLRKSLNSSQNSFWINPKQYRSRLLSNSQHACHLLCNQFSNSFRTTSEQFSEKLRSSATEHTQNNHENSSRQSSWCSRSQLLGTVVVEGDLHKKFHFIPKSVFDNLFCRWFFQSIWNFFRNRSGRLTIAGGVDGANGALIAISINSL